MQSPTLAAMDRHLKEHPSARISLARRLRAERAARGLSQEELAALAGLDRGYVGSIERSERAVSLDSIEKLANALALDIPALLTPT